LARTARGSSQLAGIGFQLVLATAMAVALGISAGTENFLLIGVMLGGATVMLSALNWRRHLIPAIFAYVCVEGFLSLLFRQYKASLLLKDFLIVIAYVSFIMEMVSKQRFVFFRGILVPMGVIALLAIAQVFNPALPNVLVGVVGFKILCFYMPLVFLGYYCFSNMQEIRKFLLLLLVFSIPVGMMAIWQYVEGPSALTRFGYSFEIAVVETPGSEYGVHTRAIGTFASPGMLSWYALCTLTICVISLALVSRLSHRLFVVGCLVLAAVTSLASGTRGGFVVTALTIGTMLLLVGRRRHLATGAVLTAMAVAIVAVFMGQAVLGRLETLGDFDLLWARLRMPFATTGRALNVAPLGWGLGYGSVGTRHVIPGGQPLLLVENYWTKIAFELGWFGLLAFAWLIAASLLQGIHSYRSCLTREARWVVGCLAVFLTGLLALSFIGTALDKIPANVYFWFFLGVMLRVPELPMRAPPSEPTEPVPRPPRPEPPAAPQGAGPAS